MTKEQALTLCKNLTDIRNIKARFRSSIKRGTGEAYLIIQSSSSIDFSNDIIKASLTNFAYDGQAEGTRADYIYELITLSKQREKIREVILKGLATEHQDSWALVQLFDLAAIFAKHGDSDAKKAIYKRFYHKTIYGSEWCGYDSIIALDGLNGLKFIATTIGKALEKNPDDWQDDMIIRHFQDENPKVNARKELEKESQKNSHIKVYLENIDRTEKRRKNYQRPTFNLDTLRERIAKSESIYIPIPRAFIKSISDSEINILADELLAEKDKKRLGKYLSLFSRIKFPYDYAPLLKLAKARVSKDRIAEGAVESLSFFSGRDIRNFALEKLRHPNCPSIFTNLLVSNYRKGDAKLLTSLANKCKNEHEIHDLVFSYVAIYKANKTAECKKPLEAIYDKLTCGIHRTDIVNILKDNNVLSKRIREEIKHDSSKETRRIAFEIVEGLF